MGHAFLRALGSVEVKQRCTKAPYETAKRARRAMGRGMSRHGRGLVAFGSGILNVYRCPICGAWHIGHK